MDGVFIVYRNSMSVCMCSVWTSSSQLQLPWDKQMECSSWSWCQNIAQPRATNRSPRTSGFTLTTATVTTSRFSTAADTPIQPTRTLPSVQRDWPSTESDDVAPTCRRAHFSGFLQRDCNPCCGITSLITRVAPRFELVIESDETPCHH